MADKSRLVTLCILSRNEYRMLEACLNYHARFFEYIVVLDGSDDTDRVKGILARHGAAGIYRKFSGSFAQERNDLAANAPTDWIFMVDCDELADWGLLSSLDARTKTDAAAYRIKRLNIEPLDPNPETYGLTFYDKKRAKYDRTVHEILVDRQSGKPIDQMGWAVTIDDRPTIHALKHPEARAAAWDRWNAMSQDSSDVLVAVLVRNQAKWLPRFLESLDKLEYDRKHLYYAFLEGDSNDGSFEMLAEWAKSRSNAMIGKMAVPTNLGRFERLAQLRNALVERFAGEDIDYFLWLDSDIILQPDTLRRLMKIPGSVVAPMIFIEGTPQFYDTLAFRKDGARFTHTYPYCKGFTQGAQQVDSVGTCYLVDAKVYKSGVRYADGESEQVSFCNAARNKGFTIWLDAGQKICHINLSKYGERWH